MKIRNLILVLVLGLFLLGCTGPAFPEEGAIQPFMKICQESEECIPDPSKWEPTECINSIYKDDFEKPSGVPSNMAKEGIVYNVWDCLCVQDTCTNKALLPEILPSEA